jgi:hypothetical protein
MQPEGPGRELVPKKNFIVKIRCIITHLGHNKSRIRFQWADQAGSVFQFHPTLSKLFF